MTDHYNGWTNRETWTVNNWIHHYIDVPSLVKDHIGNDIAKEHLADFLKDFFAEVCFPNIEGIYKDLLHIVLYKVNWVELASTYIDDELSQLDAQKIAGYEE
jgi:hypothetical protein